MRLRLGILAAGVSSICLTKQTFNVKDKKIKTVSLQYRAVDPIHGDVTAVTDLKDNSFAFFC